MEEQWRSVKGYEGIYEVSSLGRFRRITGLQYCRDREGILAPTVRPDGYCRIGLHSDGKRICKYAHVLVAEAFLENTENKKEVNHKDGNKANNRVDNLEWVTPHENVSHMIASGVQKGRWALSDDDVRGIISLEHTTSVKNIARLYGVKPITIYQIFCGNNWSHLTGRRKARKNGTDATKQGEKG